MPFTRSRPPVDLAAEELQGVRGELARIDAKVGTLTGLSGAALAFLVTQMGSREPWQVKALLIASAVAFALAAGLLLRIVRPRFGGRGFCRYAAMTSQEARAALAVGVHQVRFDRAGDLVWLSQMVYGKYRAMRRAIDVLTVGLVLLGAAQITGVIA